MSIYGSFCCMGDGDDMPAPLRYRGSHVMPTLGDDRYGSLDLGLICGWITSDGWCVHGHDSHDEMDCEDADTLPAVWPYLRVSVSADHNEGVTVVLDRDQVIALRDELTGWIGRTLDGDPATPTPEGRNPR